MRRPTMLRLALALSAWLLAAPAADSTAQDFCEVGNTDATFTADQTVTVAGTAGDSYDLTLTAVGGSGGGNGRSDSSRRKGGSGATVGATFVVPGGTSLAVFVGRGGGSSVSGSGGGGTAVVADQATLLLLAGAGAGAGQTGQGGGGSSAFTGPGGGDSGSVGGGGGGGGFGSGNGGSGGFMGGGAATLTSKGTGGGRSGSLGGTGFGGGGGGDMGGGGGGGYRGGNGGSGGGFAGGTGGTSYVETASATFRLLTTPSATDGTAGAGTVVAGTGAYGAGDNGSVTFSCTAHVPTPEITVKGNGTAITSGDTTPSADDHTLFGTLMGGGSISRTFTIENSGDATLSSLTITFGGTNPGDFSVTTPPAASVGTGGSTTFMVAFTPTGGSLRTATLTIDTNDPDEDPFTFTVQGVNVPTTPQVYWVEQVARVVRRANPDGSDVGDVLALSGSSSPQGLAVDEQHGKVYWTDNNLNVIRRANLDGSGQQDVVTSSATSIDGPQDIALDVAGGKMYWVDRLLGTLKRADLTGAGAVTLVSGLTNPEGLALDLSAGRIYFTDAGLDQIRRVHLDGTGSETLVTGLNIPYGIDLDVACGKLYWVDAGFNHLRRANLDGTGAETLASNLGAPEGVAVDAASGKVYWTETGADAIKRANLDGSGAETLVTGQGYAGDLHLTGSAVLPVELTAFTAAADGDAVVLRWQTASEANNAGFEVQRLDAEAWTRVAFVEGHGTTAEARAYTHTVAGLAPGRHVFRLRQVDYDGAYEYSPEVEVTVELAEAFHLSEAYPNPFNPQTTFTLAVRQAQRVEVGVYDVLGRRVALLFDGVLEAGAAHAFRFDGGGLPSGTYLVRVAGEAFRDVQRVTLVK